MEKRLGNVTGKQLGMCWATEKGKAKDGSALRAGKALSKETAKTKVSWRKIRKCETRIAKGLQKERNESEEKFEEG